MSKPKPPTTREDRLAERMRQVEEANETPADAALRRRLRGEKRPKRPDAMTVEEVREHLAENRR